MNEKKQTHRWMIDAILFTVFIAAFFLNLTGLPLHQWIGVIAAVLAGYHIISHWNWVTTITGRFFGRTSAKARTYYLLDAAILIGMTAIGFTGLIISTWLNLVLTNYIAWKTVHVAASVVTLVAVVLKIGLHSRWIVSTARNLFVSRSAPVQQPVVVPTAISSQSVLTRRDFLKLAGVVGTASFVAVTQALSNLVPVEAENAEPASAQPVSPAAQASSSTTNVAASATAVPTAAAATAAIQDVYTIQPTATVDTSSQAASTTTCRLICDKKCSFPGRCRRYIDTNGNNLCDNGECL
jgi:hypothetical protein